MSRDIRSYFTSVSKKPTPTKTDTPSGNNSKKRSITDLNTSDDIVPETPENVKKPNRKSDKSQSKRRRIVTVSSDSETENDRSKVVSSKTTQKISTTTSSHTITSKDNNETRRTTKPNQKTTKDVEGQKVISKKKVNPFDAFGSEPVVQEKVKKNQKSELNIHEDDDFDKTLIDLDEDELFQKAEINTTQKEDRQHNKKSSVSSDDSKHAPTKKKEERPHVNISSVSSDDSKNTPKKKKEGTPAKKDHDHKEKTPSRKRKSNDDEDDPTGDPDQDRFEKKRYSAMLYQKYLSRSGPAHLGAKWIPKGKPNCLNGLCFIITGVLDSMQRDDAQALIVEHGGRCTQSVSGKVNYMVLGDDAGPSKVEKARKLGTKMISEDDLIDLICLKSGIKNENKIEPSSENNSSQISSTSPPAATQVKQEKSSTSVKKEKNKTPVKQERTKTPVKQERTKTPVKQERTKPPVKKEQISDDEDEIPSTTVKQEVERVTIVPKTVSSKKKTSPAPAKPEKKIDMGNLAWVDRYKPADISQIIGQQGERSNMNKLIKWLQNWQKNRTRETSGKGIPKPSPWAKDDDGAFFRAALLSGPPGVGKTTTATLVCKHLGLDTVEFNASDTRNKRMVHAEISHILNTTSLAGYVADGAAPTRQHALLMDEVDGMSGNEDRGGIQELIGLIKTSNIPIICMCNDRQHPKIRTLANYCFDLRFSKPKVEQIRGAMMSICFKEKLPIKGDAVSQIIQGTGQDVRQTLNQLALLAAGSGGDAEQVAKQAKAAQKDVKLGPWEVIRKVFSEEEHKTMSFMDHSKLFFYDYSIGPLFVQENYLKVVPHCPKPQHLQRFAQAADAISMGDVVDARIRSTQSWGLLDLQAMYASVLPGHYLRGHMGGQIDFPSWLGKNSRATKFKRLISEIHGHTRMSTSCDRTSVSLDLVRPLRDAVAGPLLRDGADGVAAAMDTMRAYSLLREDLTSLVELAHWPRTRDPFEQVDPKVKAAFTRAYNKETPALPYAAPAAVPVKKRAAAASEEMYGEEDDAAAESDEEKVDDINTDGMIKMKKPGTTKTAAASKPSSSKGKASTKGRGGKRGK